MHGLCGGVPYDPKTFNMMSGPSNPGQTRRFPNSSMNRQPSEYMSTAVPRLLFLNISGAMYGKFPYPY